MTEKRKMRRAVRRRDQQSLIVPGDEVSFDDSEADEVEIRHYPIIDAAAARAAERVDEKQGRRWAMLFGILPLAAAAIFAAMTKKP